MNDKLVKEIREALDNSDIYCKDYFKDLLHKALVDSGEDKLEHYNRGCEDAWNFCRKLELTEICGGFNLDMQREVFGDHCDYLIQNILVNYKTYKEALAKVEAYEQKKKEEAEKPVIGDVVVIYTKACASDKSSIHGIFLGESIMSYWVLINEISYPQYFDKSEYVLKKTGKHVDIQGMLDELKED